MFNIWTIAKREYKLYFASPVAYAIAFFVLLVVGGVVAASLLFTMQSMGQVPPPDVTTVIYPLMFLLVFICPALTMRLLSEEQRLGTIELLLTAPVRDWELVMGKWLGAFFFIATLIGITLFYPIVMNWLIDPGIDQGPLVTGYLGMLLVSGAFLGIGVFISALFSNQVASYLTTFGILVFFWLVLRIIIQVAGPTMGNFLGYIDFSGHFYNNLISGLIELGDVVYFVSVTALSIFLGSVVVEMRRWR